MTTLDDCPYETIVNIFSFLSQASLANVSLVSRRWHVLSEPVLYREPDLYRHENARHTRGIELFVRTLLVPGGERLATHVRSIYMHWNRTVTTVVLTPRRRSNLAIIGAAGWRFGVTHSSVYESPDSQAVLLMHMLPRLRKLELAPYDERDTFNDFLDTIRPGQAIPLSFRLLTIFDCDWCGNNIGVRPHTVVALMQLPHIRKLNANVNGDFDGPFPANCHGTSGVTRLCLGYSPITAGLLAFFLGMPRALERFHYSSIFMDGFAEILWPLRFTLTHLHLNFDDNEEEFDQRMSLRAWPVLRNVGCPLELLLGCAGPADGWQLAEKLPLSIRKLRVTGWENYSETAGWKEEDRLDVVVQMLSKEKQLVPGLVKLTMYGRSHDRLQARELRERLRAACVGARVALVTYEGDV